MLKITDFAHDGHSSKKSNPFNGIKPFNLLDKLFGFIERYQLMDPLQNRIQGRVKLLDKVKSQRDVEIDTINLASESFCGCCGGTELFIALGSF